MVNLAAVSHCVVARAPADENGGALLVYRGITLHSGSNASLTILLLAAQMILFLVLHYRLDKKTVRLAKP
jgi:hypothetical protein